MEDEHQILDPGAHEIWLRRQEANQALQSYKYTLLDADICHAVSYWLYESQLRGLLGRETLANYRRYMQDLVGHQIFRLDDVQEGNILVRELPFIQNEIFRRLENRSDLDLNQQRYRVGALISFSKFLEHELDGKVKRLEAPPSLSLGSVNRKPAPRVLSMDEFRRLAEAIKINGLRDYCAICLIFFTARNLGEILKLKTDDLDFDRSAIRFKDTTIVNAAPMPTLRTYLEKSKGDRKNDVLFVTSNGKSIYRTHFNHLLIKASEKADLGFTVTLKMIQWAWVAHRLERQEDLKKILKHLCLKTIPKYLEIGLG